MFHFDCEDVVVKLRLKRAKGFAESGNHVAIKREPMPIEPFAMDASPTTHEIEVCPSTTKRLGAPPSTAQLTISSVFDISVDPNRVLEVIFRTFDPHHLGIIDCHSPSRAYQREIVGGLTLNLESFEQQRRQQSLYNWQSKYTNVKTELAANYVRELIADKAGVKLEGATDLNQTLTELFQTFFPDKKYQGPRPTSGGVPEFPVLLATGEEHDIDDLSSGEKEVLYGYLRLRDSAPQNSVVLPMSLSCI